MARHPHHEGLRRAIAESSTCGPGGKGPIKDPIDKMCWEHDKCYDAAGATWWDNVRSPKGQKKECMKNCDEQLCKKLMAYKPRTKDEFNGWFEIAVYFDCK